MEENSGYRGAANLSTGTMQNKEKYLCLAKFPSTERESHRGYIQNNDAHNTVMQSVRVDWSRLKALEKLHCSSCPRFGEQIVAIG